MVGAALRRPHAGGSAPAARRGPSLVVLLVLTAAAFSVGWAQKLPCRVHGYGAGNTYAYSHFCYSDVYVAWTAEGLSEGKRPYVDHPVEYPVLLGGLMAVAAVGAHSAGALFDHTAVLLLLGALVVTATTAVLLGPQRRGAAAMVAIAPAVVLHGTVSWDLAAAAFAGLGLVAWSRHRHGRAGLAFGIGTAIKLYPIIFLVPLLVLSVRARRVRAWAVTSVAALATWVLCNAAVAAVAGTFVFAPGAPPRNAVLRFFLFNRDRPADWDSVWFVLEQLLRSLRRNAGWMFPVATVNLLSGVVLVASLGAVVLLLWRSAAPARVGQAVFLATAAFLLTSKVFSPQYSIWLVPLAVIAGVRWEPFLGWQVLELVLVFTRYAFLINLADPDGGLPVRFFAAAVVARDLALAGLIWLVVRDIRRAPAIPTAPAP